MPPKPKSPKGSPSNSPPGSRPGSPSLEPNDPPADPTPDPSPSPQEDEMLPGCMLVNVVKETEVVRANNPYDCEGCDSDNDCSCHVKKDKTSTDICGYLHSEKQLRVMLMALMPTDQSSADFMPLINQAVESVIAAQKAANSSGIPGAKPLSYSISVWFNFFWWRVCINIKSK